MSIKKKITANGKVRWEVRYYLYGRKSKRVKRCFHSKADADLFYENYVIEKRRKEFAGIDPESSKEITFKTEAELWLNLEKHRFSKSHLINVTFILNRLYPRIGHLRIEQLHHATLSKLQSEFLSEGLKPANINRHSQVIIAILNSSAQNRRIPFNPASRFKKLKEPRDAVGFWERAEAESFLEFANQKYPQGSSKRWVYAVYLTAINTGARAGEIWALRPKDLDREMLVVERQFNSAESDFSTTKGKKSRKVPCNLNLLSELNGLIALKDIQEDETIFQTENRNPISHRNFVKRQFEMDLKEWGGRKIRFHDLRHTATTLMTAAGVDLKTVQEICGHSNIKTTMNYVHLLSERNRETARTFSVLPSSSVNFVGFRPA